MVTAEREGAIRDRCRSIPGFNSGWHHETGAGAEVELSFLGNGCVEVERVEKVPAGAIK